MTATDTAVRPCLHLRARHEHGDLLAYKLDRCRCGPCRVASAAETSRRARLRAYGRPTTPWVDAAPVRAHVEAARAAGMGWKSVAAAAGVESSTVSRLLYGRVRSNGQQDGPTRRMNPVAAQKLLAVPIPDVDGLRYGAKINGAGTRRRLQALVAVGWPLTRIAARMGMDPGNLSRVLRSDLVLVSTRAAAVALYDELWDQRPAPGAGPTRARRMAEARGWAPPLAWDDETIDDPRARPARAQLERRALDEIAIERAMAGDRVPLTKHERAEVVDRLTAAGRSSNEIAALLDVAQRTVVRRRAAA